MTFGGYKREKGPFVFTPEFMHVMGDSEDSSHYKQYLVGVACVVLCACICMCCVCVRVADLFL